MASLSVAQKERWMETASNVDLTHNSKMSWNTLNKLNTDKKPETTAAAVTPNQVAHQLLIYGKPPHEERGYLKKMKDKMSAVLQESDKMFLPFSKEELENGITTEMISILDQDLVTGSYQCSTVVPRNATYLRSGDGPRSSLSWNRGKSPHFQQAIARYPSFVYSTSYTNVLFWHEYHQQLKISFR